MKERSKTRLSVEKREEMYTAWLLDLIIKYGVENEIMHAMIIGNVFDKAGFNWMSQAVNFAHVRFGRDKGNRATVMFTKNALKYLEART